MHNRRSHILFIDTNDAVGGVVRVHSHLLRTFDTARFRVSLACQRGGPLHREFADGARVQCLPVDFGTKSVEQCSGLRSPARNLAGFGAFLRTALALAMHCRRQGVDIIYSSDKKRSVLITQVVAALSARPFAYHIHNVHVDYKLNRRALRKATLLLANSTAMKEDFLRNAGAGMERIHVVHNGLDPDEFQPASTSTLRAELGLPPECALVGVTTRLAPEKGHPTLLTAIARLLDKRPGSLHAVIVGDDRIYSNNRSYGDELREQTASLGIKDAVTFLGYRSDMVNICNGLDIVVDPAWEEAFGMVVIEPMACARLVIGTKAGGIPEIIENGTNGFLFPPRDAEELTRVLEHALDLPSAEREQIGAAARRTILERFTVERQTRAVEALLEGAVPSPQTRSSS